MRLLQASIVGCGEQDSGMRGPEPRYRITIRLKHNANTVRLCRYSPGILSRVLSRLGYYKSPDATAKPDYLSASMILNIHTCCFESFQE